MRKTFFIVSLLALLLFVFPLVASATPPGTDEGDDGWTILYNEFVEQVIRWFSDLQSSNWPQIIYEPASHNHELAVLRESYLIARLNALLQAIRVNILSE